MIGYKVKYHGPTNYQGSRYGVTNLHTGKRVMVDYDHSASNARKAAAESVAGRPVVYIGEGANAAYYVDAVEA